MGRALAALARDPSSAIWLCCITLFGAVWPERLWSSRDRENVEQLVDKTHLVADVRLAYEAMASADHPHHFEALDCSGCRFHGLNAPNWADDSLKRTMVCFNEVVEVLQVRCFVEPDTLPSRCSRLIALG